jgi:hypothetical protein
VSKTPIPLLGSLVAAGAAIGMDLDIDIVVRGEIEVLLPERTRVIGPEAPAILKAAALE